MRSRRNHFDCITCTTTAFAVLFSQKLVYQGNVLTSRNLEQALLNVTSVRQLNIQGNRLTTITETTFPRQFLRGVKEIDIRGNRFACTCELLWFRK